MRHLLNWRAHAIGTCQMQLYLTSDSDRCVQHAIIFTRENYCTTREERTSTAGNKGPTNGKLHEAVVCVAPVDLVIMRRKFDIGLCITEE